MINVETTIENRIQANLNFCLKPVPVHTPGIDTIPMIDLETLHIIEKKIIPAKGIETIQMIEIKHIKTIDHVIFLTTDQTIINRVNTTIKIDHGIFHKTKLKL